MECRRVCHWRCFCHRSDIRRGDRCASETGSPEAPGSPPVLRWVVIHIPSPNIVRIFFLVKSAGTMSRRRFQRKNADPGAKLHRRNARAGKLEVSIKSALPFGSFRGGVDFFAGDELLVSSCCRFEDYQIMSNI